MKKVSAQNIKEQRDRDSDVREIERCIRIREYVW
jgi:hypothetical protein